MILIFFLISFLGAQLPAASIISGDFNGDGITEKAFLKTTRENGEEITAVHFSRPGLTQWNVEKNCLIENVGNVNQIPGDEILISNLHYGPADKEAQFQIISFDSGLHQFRVCGSGTEPFSGTGKSMGEKIISKKGTQSFYKRKLSAEADTLILIED